ncbi:MAG: hypothetical protein R3F59_35505 [Myxococcota bacterium]
MCADTLRCLPLVALAGCGSLVGLDYRGEVLLELHGQVLIDGSLDQEREIGVTLLWSLAGGTRADPQSIVAHTTFPSRYTLEIDHPPQDGVFQHPYGEDWLSVAVAQPILFEDIDGDGRWDRAREQVVGGSLDRAVVWVDSVDAARAPASAAWVPERTGFQVVSVPWEPCIAREGLPMTPAAGRTDLQVGYYWPSLLDLDCDGVPDWADSGTDGVFGACGDDAYERAATSTARQPRIPCWPPPTSVSSSRSPASSRAAPTCSSCWRALRRAPAAPRRAPTRPPSRTPAPSSGSTGRTPSSGRRCATA